jgi:HlyD family secretion protein
MRKAVAAVILAAVLAGGYLVYGAGKPKPPPYRTAAVEQGDVTFSISSTGTLNAVTTVQVGSQVSGTISGIFADFNSPVRRGQPIARIDPRLFEAAVAQARANLESALAALERARIAEVDARRTLGRNLELVKDGFVAQADVDAAQTAHDLAAAQVRSAEAQVGQAEGALAVAETNLSYTTILSPVDGIVVSRDVDVGQTVAASFQTPTLFTIARDPAKMQIDTHVDEADIANAREGQEAAFTVDAYPGRTFTGAVTQVRNAPIMTENVVTYNVVIRVDNRDLLLKPGMTANVAIRTMTVHDVLKIPNAALRYRPSDRRPGEGNPEPVGTRVYVLGKGGRPEAVPVKTGIGDGVFTELVEGDLRKGDLLVTGEPRSPRRPDSGGGPPGMRMFR